MATLTPFALFHVTPPNASPVDSAVVQMADGSWEVLSKIDGKWVPETRWQFEDIMMPSIGMADYDVERIKTTDITIPDNPRKDWADVKAKAEKTLADLKQRKDQT